MWKKSDLTYSFYGEAGVAAIFIQIMMAKKTLVIYGIGKCIRDYVFVGDAARAKDTGFLIITNNRRAQ